jgi:hypothetical protein
MDGIYCAFNVKYEMILQMQSGVCFCWISLLISFLVRRDIQRGKFELIVLFPLTGQAILIYLTTLCPLLLVTVVIFSLLL